MTSLTRSIFIFSLVSSTSFAAIGQSAIITLQFPYGARMRGMGETGVALADDETALFFNPAGLGITSDKLANGTVSTFFEPLLPALNLNDLWHTTIAGAWQSRTKYVGGVGFFWNYLNFGENQRTDAWGKELGKYNAGESVVGLTYAYDYLHAKQNRNHLSYGLSLKYASSKLTENNDDIGRTFAIDATLLGTFSNGFRIGGGLYNMGPAVSYKSAAAEDSDPIPFAIRLGIAWQKEIDLDNLRLLRPSVEYSADREIVKKAPSGVPYNFLQAINYDLINDPDETAQDEWDQVIHHFGGEILVCNTASFRFGYMKDEAGDRIETTMGTGVQFLNHFKFDWGRIFSPRNRPRDGQWSINFSVYNLLNWSQEDASWFIRTEPSSTVIQISPSRQSAPITPPSGTPVVRSHPPIEQSSPQPLIPTTPVPTQTDTLVE